MRTSEFLPVRKSYRTILISSLFLIIFMIIGNPSANALLINPSVEGVIIDEWLIKTGADGVP